MRPMKPDPGIHVQTVRIPTENGGVSALLLSPLAAPKNAAGILWLHGGAYIAGMKEMVHASRAIDDCYAALLYLKAHAAAFGVRSDQLMVGGESAGVPAELDVYHSDMHAFDMMRPDDVLSIQAAEAFNTRFADAQARFFAPQHEIQEERHDS